jgi:uncharacterized membrane protein YkoI
MKKLFVVSICAALVFGACAQEKKDEIPAAAKSAFATNFPNATKVEWGIEKEGEYEAEFKLDGSEMSVLFNAQGDLLETEAEVKDADLPEAVKATISSELAGFKIDEIEKTTDAKGVVTYEMEAKKDKEEFEVVIDATGKLIKKEAEKEESDNDKD